MLTISDYTDVVHMVKALHDTLDIPCALLYYNHTLQGRCLEWPGESDHNDRLLIDHKKIEIRGQTREKFSPSRNNILGFVGRLHFLDLLHDATPPSDSWRIDTMVRGSAINFGWQTPSATSFAILSTPLRHLRLNVKLKVFYHPTHKAWTFVVLTYDDSLFVEKTSDPYQFFVSPAHAITAAEHYALKMPALPRRQGYTDILFSHTNTVFADATGFGNIKGPLVDPNNPPMP